MQTTSKTHEFRSLIPTTLEIITRFHEKQAALSMLTPPSLIVKIVNDQRVSLTEGSVDFILWFGPVPVRWLARHEPGPTPTSFIDRMIIGPMAEWEHQHIFRAVADSVELIDRVTLIHKPGWPGWISRLAFDGLALRFLFWYRHWRTERECRKMMFPLPSPHP